MISLAWSIEPGLAFNAGVFAFLAVLVVFTAFSRDWRRRAVAFLILLLSMAASLAAYAGGYGEPALFVVAACFAIALASLETRLFPWLALASALAAALLFAAGASPASVCAGFVFAVLSRYAVEWLARRFLLSRLAKRFFYSAYVKAARAKKEEKEGLFEYRRKAFHFMGGLVILAVPCLFGREAGLAFASLGAFVSLLIINTLAMRNRLFTPVLDALERHGKRPLDGVLWFFAGAAILLLFARSMGFVSAGIYVMAAGDAAAAIFGKRFGFLKWPHNQKKSFVGSAAFVFASLPALLFGVSPLLAVPAIALCAMLESFDFGVDDNIIAAIVFTVLSHA